MPPPDSPVRWRPPVCHPTRPHQRLRATAIAAVAIGLLAPGTAVLAQEATQQVAVTGRHHDNAIGSADAASQGAVRAELLRARPTLRPGELLEFVPGVIVTQHSGDGKANQYFLRGFNLDHGTDFATSVNGTPVNMPSHGHGQGYSDLNFLLPELVERIAYRKGPYFAQNGDFASAGSADVVYRHRLDAPFGQLTLGGNGYRRGVAGASLALQGDRHLLGALELQRNDGPWAVPQGLHKANAVVTLSGGTVAQGWHASWMHHSARWTATDQIPQRLLDAGGVDGRPFGRFDSLDPTSGGDTRRSSLSAQWQRRGGTSAQRLAAYLIDYRLALFSNFTYALDRPADGDQFTQRDRRRVAGLSASHAVDHAFAGLDARSEFGLQLRHDRARVALADSVARRPTNTVRDDRVRQTQVGLYGQTVLTLSPWLRAVAALRLDDAQFRVDSQTQAANGGRSSDRQLSPKLSLIAGPWARTELFFNAGRGMHSNDARGTTARVDPRSGDAVQRVPGLVATRGLEFGLRSEWLPGLNTSLALWGLDLDSELVYVGDAGTTEASRPSRRRGIEWSNRWAPSRWLLVDADLAWSHARFRGHDPAGDRIPNSIDTVASVSLSLRDRGPWTGSLQWRYLGSGALTEDNRVRAPAALTTNLRIGHATTAGTSLTLDVFNLFDRRVNDIGYFYTSRLPGEAAPVADRHLHPAEPRTLRLTLAQQF